MADTASVGAGREDGQSASTPRALIHKKILEAAAADPDATMADIADDVSGASTDLVERVLDEYGDPGADENGNGDDGPVAASTGAAAQHGTGETGGSSAVADPPESVTEPADSKETGEGSAETPGTGAGGDSPAGAEEAIERGQETGERQTEAARMTDDTTASVPTPDELSDKERAVLEAVSERPTATQQELADALGVSRATISKRANGIDGFDWQHRVAFVEGFFDDSRPALSADGRGELTGDGPGHAESARGSNADDAAPATVEQAAAHDRSEAPDASGADSSARSSAPGERIEPPGERVESVGDRIEAVVHRLDSLDDRIAAVEEQFDAAEPAGSTRGSIDDPPLAHKVVHACMNAETISEDEELRVIAAVISADTSW